MTSSHPHDTPPGSPEPLDLPSGEDWPRWFDARVRAQLAAADEGAERIHSAAPSDGLAVLRRWDAVQLALANVAGLSSLVSQSHPDAAVREAAEQAVQEAQRLGTALAVDPDLYAVLAAIDAEALPADAARALRLTLRDFRRSGVDRGDDVRARVRELADRETVLAQDFSRNIRDDVRSLRLTTAQLAGLPDDYLERHPADDEGLRTVTTDYPDIYPLLTYCADADVRRSAHRTFLNRGWPVNDGVLRELLGLRAEHASVLGYDGWPDFDAEVKMIGDGDAIAAFIDEVAAAAAEPAIRDRDVLLARMRQDHPDAATIDRADSAFYAELVRRERFDVDAQEVRRYFDFAKVRQGLLDVTGRLFGIAYHPVPEAPTWHEDVTVYDVVLDGERIGRIHLDLHPREGKYKHAAQFDLARGVRGRQLAEGALLCNLPRGLMEHSDVVTLFHEFGHLVHHVLAGRHDWVRFSGVATEWDFVEAPSQLLEEWARDADVLAGFATDSDGVPIPRDLVERMRRAQEFGTAYSVRTQMFYASVSYDLHQRPLTGSEDELTARVRELQTTYDVFPYVEGTHFHASFGHLGGYTSAYYTYMWSLVIAKDLFSQFDPADLYDADVARRYRDRIVAAGGSRDAADLVRDFLGRDYSVEAFRAWLAR